MRTARRTSLCLYVCGDVALTLQLMRRSSASFDAMILPVA